MDALGGVVVLLFGATPVVGVVLHLLLRRSLFWCLRV